MTSLKKVMDKDMIQLERNLMHLTKKACRQLYGDYSETQLEASLREKWLFDDPLCKSLTQALQEQIAAFKQGPVSQVYASVVTTIIEEEFE